MFNSIKKDTLLRMIPPVLREFSLKELQEKCAFELEGFSRKRARAVLNGLDMISSSGTDDSDEEVQNEDQNQLVNLEIMEESPVPALKEYVAPLALSRQNLDSGEIIMDLSGEPVVSELNKDSCLTTVEPLEMELVELELRAQAIRALMQQLDEDDLSLPAPRHRRSDSLRSSASPQSNPDDLLSTELCSMISSDVRKSSRGEKEYFQIHADEEELAEFD
ncbi:uncharacterized protein LOC129585751 [Paramacrobiotus metropolitanus]|uniref:uncharacterized protein LOC129585751 n=1 Tax=Paramacrobiotus metropolitanus TaxID=2943436 RepID=UPI0024463D86|nr:uncharacterized protein LOC129585751 [Paramacrobiotus metropolitanus]